MRQALALAAILALAGALRLCGIAWGIPDETHPGYSYHPDEARMVAWAQWLVEGRHIPEQFIYGGTLSSTLINADRHFGHALHPWLQGTSPLADTILAGRYFNLILSLLTILLVYEIGRQLFDSSEGLVAAAIVAVAPVHVFMAQNIRPDEAGTFVAALLLFLSARILRADPQTDRRFFIYAGFTLGAGVALRFPLAAFGLTPFVAWLLREPPANLRSALTLLLGRRTWLLVAASAIGYAIASPQTFLDLPELIGGVARTWSFETGVFPDAAERGPGVLQYGWTQLREALGIPLHLLGLAAILCALLRRSPATTLVLAALVPYFVLTTFASWVVVRYTLPMIPMIALLIASAVSAAARVSRSWRTAATIALTGALAWTLLSDVAFARIAATRNVREEAADWIAMHAPPKSSVATVWQYDNDVYLNPVMHGDLRLYAVITDPSAAQALSSGAIDFLVLNETVYKNMERLGDRHPYEGIRAFRKAFLSAPYHLVAEFQKPVRFAGVDFSDTFTSQDYAVVNPGIRIYQRD